MMSLHVFVALIFSASFWNKLELCYREAVFLLRLLIHFWYFCPPPPEETSCRPGGFLWPSEGGKQIKLFSDGDGNFISSAGFGAPYGYSPAAPLPAYSKPPLPLWSIINNPSIIPSLQLLFFGFSSGLPSRLPSVVFPVIRVPPVYPVTHLYPY